MQDQAVKRAGLFASVLVICLMSSGCSRMLQAIFAPQETISNSASAVSNRIDSATAPAYDQTVAMQSDVNRLLAQGPVNPDELQRIKAALDAQNRNRLNAQRSMKRMRSQGDTFRLASPGSQVRERGTPSSDFIPDGIAPGKPLPPIDMTPVRMRQ